MFDPQYKIENYTLHTQIAQRSNGRDLSFQNLEEFSSYLLISKSYDQFTMAL